MQHILITKTGQGQRAENVRSITFGDNEFVDNDAYPNLSFKFVPVDNDDVKFIT